MKTDHMKIRTAMTVAAREAEDYVLGNWDHTHSRDDAVLGCRLLARRVENLSIEELWDAYEEFKDDNPWAAEMADGHVFADN